MYCLLLRIVSKSMVLHHIFISNISNWAHMFAFFLYIHFTMIALAVKWKYFFYIYVRRWWFRIYTISSYSDDAFSVYRLFCCCCRRLFPFSYSWFKRYLNIHTFESRVFLSFLIYYILLTFYNTVKKRTNIMVPFSFFLQLL